LDLAAVAHMSVENLPDIVLTEYMATVGNGNGMVVTRLRHDLALASPRLFYGPETRMEERTVLGVAVAGVSRTITFDLDSTEARICFGCEEPIFLEIDNQQIPVTQLDPALEELGKFSFFCIR
jgi:hypothetical protein